jgi:hypothetical protein
MGAKDWLIQKAAVAMLNQAIVKRYGTITDLKLDTTRRSIDALVELNGEAQPIRVQIHEYELLEENGASFLVIRAITTSREWLTALARDYAVGRRFEIPESARSYLPMLM